MEILFISTTNSLGLAGRLVDEGHTVKVWGVPTANNFVEIVKHPYEAIKSCKFIIVEGTVGAQVYEWAKTFNKPIIGATPLTDMLNINCYREWQIASKLGVPLPITEVIEDISDMYTKVLEWNNARTLIRYDRVTISCDYQRWLAWAMHKLPIGKKILLQKPTWGEELQVVGWFDGLRWARPFILKSGSEEQLRGSTILALQHRDWIERLIVPWEAFLRSVEYKGPFRVKAIASRKTLQTIGVHAGLESPSLYAFLEGLKEPIGEFLHKIAFGVCEKVDITTDYASCAIVGTVLKEPGGVPIVGLDEGNRKHMFFGYTAMSGEDLVVAQNPDWIYALTAHGRDIDESWGRLYHTHNIVRVPEPNIMTGLASVHKQWFNKMRELEYI